MSYFLMSERAQLLMHTDRIWEGLARSTAIEYFSKDDSKIRAILYRLIQKAESTNHVFLHQRRKLERYVEQSPKQTFQCSVQGVRDYDVDQFKESKLAQNVLSVVKTYDQCNALVIGLWIARLIPYEDRAVLIKHYDGILGRYLSAINYVYEKLDESLEQEDKAMQVTLRSLRLQHFLGFQEPSILDRPMVLSIKIAS